MPPSPEVPRELDKISLPEYVIEPPDILLVDIVRVLPKQPYRITPLDVLSVDVEGGYPGQPIRGPYTVDVAGVVNLGPAYGPIRVAGLTIEEARAAIDQQLRRFLQAPQVSVGLVQAAAKQLIAGEHLVGPDGTVTLGVYGSVYVTGLTLAQAKYVIESHLSQFLESPEVSVDVFGYNSKVYYVITEGAGLGDNVTRFPMTGNETVLDALAQVNGLQAVSSKRIWVSRPAPHGCGTYQVLLVNYQAITKGASTATNYQLLPGDRVFIAQDRMVAFDTALAKILTPFERTFGFTLLGTATVQQITNGNQNGIGFF